MIIYAWNKINYNVIKIYYIIIGYKFLTELQFILYISSFTHLIVNEYIFVYKGEID